MFADKRGADLPGQGGFLPDGDAVEIQVLWHASAAVRRGDLQNQGLGATSLATQVAGLL